MARKGMPRTIAAFIKRLFGHYDGVYHFFKKIMYFCISFIRFFRIITPVDLVYRIFPARAPMDAGYVTKVNSRGITGLAFYSGKEPVKVDLLVDGKVINSTWSTQKVFFPSCYAGLTTGFYFPMKQIWQYILRGRKIEVLADGFPLRYRAGPGSGKTIPNRGVKRLSGKSIAELVSEGRLINKFGRIQGPRNESSQWASRVIGNYNELNEIFERLTGKSLFAFYGVLLGYAREGGVLAHDMDLDLAYFSEETDPDAVRREFKSITKKLIDAGITVKPHTYKLQFGGRGLSVTPCWISSGIFSSTFGYAGDGFSVKSSDIIPLKSVEHKGYKLLLPGNPAAVAKYLYGHGWKYPDPGWKWLSEYKNRPEILAARLKESDLKDLGKLVSSISNDGGV